MSKKDFMKANLCEQDTRQLPEAVSGRESLRHRIDSLALIVKLGFISFAATNHFYLVRHGRRRGRGFRHHLMNSWVWPQWRDRNLAGIQRTCAGSHRSAPFFVSSGLRSANWIRPSCEAESQPLCVVGRDQQGDHSGSLSFSRDVAIQEVLADRNHGDIFKDGGGLALIAGTLDCRWRARPRAYRAGQSRRRKRHRSRAPKPRAYQAESSRAGRSPRPRPPTCWAKRNHLD